MHTGFRMFFYPLFFLLFCACSSLHADLRDDIILPTVKGIQLLPHPRLLFTKNEETAVRQLIKTDPTAKGLSVLLQMQAQNLLEAEQLPYKMGTDGTLLHTSREYVYRLFTLSLAYRLFGAKVYADKVNETLLWLCKYPDWHPDHYLDTAEMTTAIAIAYDWLFDTLSSDTKEMVRKCFHERAFKFALQAYANGTENSWAKRETNWNVVCNTGMVLGALATADEKPETTTLIIDNAIRYIPNCMKHFAPDGVCYEGPSYWGYTNIYLAMFIKAMNDNFKTDYGISSLPGISQTARFYVRTTSPSGKVFNFADAGSTDPDCSPSFFLFSKFFGQPEIASWYRAQLKKIVEEQKTPKWHFFLSIPWFDAAKINREQSLPTLETFYGINDIIVFNGNKKAGKPLYLIAKGADPDMAHQQLDGGTFVVETEGVRWFDDLGSESYSLPGFWDYKPAGKRWTYFRNNNLSHNTLSIDGKIQHSGGTAHLVKEENKGEQPYASIDMTSLYKDQASSVWRTFRMIDPESMELTDEMTLLNENSEVCWSAVTRAEVQTDRNEAILKSGGKQFFIRIITPEDAVFTTQPATPYSDMEKRNEGVTCLQCRYKPKKKELKIIVRMSSEYQNF